MQEKRWAQHILQILQREFALPAFVNEPREPFPTLIRTILSQATNDNNMEQAFRNLDETFDITPQTLADGDVSKIETAIRVGGLYRNKAQVIQKVAQIILEQFGGTLNFIYSSPIEESRKLLMSLPGVGPKTADVVLLFAARKPLLPVDTHVNRVSKRLGMVPLQAGYEDTRLALEDLFPPEDRQTAHLMLIMLGRKYCKARKPLHTACPLSELCPSAEK
jgi:endonuclease-3